MKKESIWFILAMVVLFGGYIAVQNHYLQKQRTLLTQNMSPSGPQTTHVVSEPTVQTSAAPEKLNFTPSAEALRIEVPYALLTLTAQGGCLGTNLLTKEHVAYNNPTPVSVIDNHQLCKAFGFQVGAEDLRQQAASISKNSDGSTLIVQQASGLEVRRTLKFDEANYMGELTIEVKNISQAHQNVSVDMEIGASSDSNHSGGFLSTDPPQFHAASVRLHDGTVEREYTPFAENPTPAVLLSENNVLPTWLNVESLYWMNTLIPQFHTLIHFELKKTGYNLRKNPTAAVDQTVYEAWIKHPVQLSPGRSVTFPYKIYFGPKNEKTLESLSEYHLSDTIDYGFFKIIARPLYYVLAFLQDIVKNWGVAIILLTILINIVFLPLQIKSYVSAQKMQKLQPFIKELQEKYKNDKHTLQREMMSLMSKQGVNPLSGCLPLLPQIPVFFGLNSALNHTFGLRQAPFFFWIHDLTLHDPYFVLPVIMAALMLMYQKMVPIPSMDPTQAKMMKILPIVFSVFMIVYPSGLAIYVITNTLVSMIRQSILTRRFAKK